MTITFSKNYMARMENRKGDKIAGKSMGNILLDRPLQWRIVRRIYRCRYHALNGFGVGAL